MRESDGAIFSPPTHHHLLLTSGEEWQPLNRMAVKRHLLVSKSDLYAPEILLFSVREASDPEIVGFFCFVARVGKFE